jgi:hypothetical protein
MNKRKLLIVLLILLTMIWLVPAVIAAPLTDAVVPTFTPTPTITLTLPPPTAPPPPTATIDPYPAAQNPTAALPTATSVVANDPGDNAIPENNDTQAEAAGSSILGFLLCVGVMIVAGLAALNIWSRRRP